MEEAEKEYKKISEKIDSRHKAMKASYAKIMADAQAIASRVCKTSIFELSKSFEKGIDDLRNRFGTPST
ncbi:putative polyamine transporter [Hibiscus syriacus]|uniref:Polyamine transporter n=1 Tax=Hibiscus syriacus TaxID=106335 RepID=A0A6A2Z0B0_HIBSY|nr:putative polyamine transporter [Hibiscus syriacus]